ncbi:hypothetical protein CMO94_03320 [Candidatus Woesearchaeota archaeon]|jgi:hypothetical protein|nr:hypothetical protein [Candidatus Woesearchaeota archaeon]|tara:strand:- start:5164 stop:5598 length:435 start_codon:yes stop_codon:yes gene_type:complete
MLKKFSSPKIVEVLTEVTIRSGIYLSFKKGRPCEIKKEKLVSFVIFARLCDDVCEQMELDSEVCLGRYYDHSAFQYHYTRLSENAIQRLTSLFRDKIYVLVNEIYLHIFDSTALSTTVPISGILSLPRGAFLEYTRALTALIPP